MILLIHPVYYSVGYTAFLLQGLVKKLGFFFSEINKQKGAYAQCCYSQCMRACNKGIYWNFLGKKCVI